MQHWANCLRSGTCIVRAQANARPWHANDVRPPDVRPAEAMVVTQWVPARSIVEQLFGICSSPALGLNDSLPANHDLHGLAGCLQTHLHPRRESAAVCSRALPGQLARHDSTLSSVPLQITPEHEPATKLNFDLQDSWLPLACKVCFHHRSPCRLDRQPHAACSQCSAITKANLYDMQQELCPSGPP